MKKIQRRLAAIMFTDMVGYSALMQKDEQVAQEQRNRHREVFVSNTNRFGGEILQYYGDGTLSIYPSASAAVECAMNIQRELKQEPSVLLRIGIHTGDISFGDEDVYGDGVNVAKRIETLCVPGGIFISGKVYDDIKNHSVIKTRSIGPFKLKNIIREIEIIAVTNEGITAPPPGHYHKISPFARKPAVAPKTATATRSTTTATPRTAPFAPQVARGRKKKVAAGLLALFLGIFGAHRFYLGQRRLGMLYLGVVLAGMFFIRGLADLIPIVAIISFIDAMIFFSMSVRDFDLKYNTNVPETGEVLTRRQKRSQRRRERFNRRRQPRHQPQKSQEEEQFDKLWKEALGEYREYDYDEAISLFEQAAEIKPNDPEVHFMLARCYSVNEDIGNALTHLDLATAFDLVDQGRIQTHKDLAYLRMQPQFEAFAKNGYRLFKELPEPVEDLLQSKSSHSPDLLEQLQELNKLRQEGQLTEMEYQIMVKKLNQ